MTGYRVVRDNELYHYGVKGMKWGVRRFQNKNGSYTALGKIRYNKTNNLTESDKRLVNETYSYRDDNKNFYELHGKMWNKSGSLSQPKSERMKKVAMEYHELMENVKKQYGIKEKKEKLESMIDEGRERIASASTKLFGEKITPQNYYEKIVPRSEKEKKLEKKLKRDIKLIKLAKNIEDLQHEISITWDKIVRETSDVMVPKVASAVLLDLGYDDTEIARKFLIDNEYIELLL